MRHLPLLVVLVLGSGCASNLSTLQTARTLAPGQVQVSLGAGAYVPVGQLLDVVDIGIDQGKQLKRDIENGESVHLTEADQQRLLTSGVALAVGSPGVVNELMIRAGLAENFDMGLRYSGISLRLDAKYRFLHTGNPDPVSEDRGSSFDMAIGIGAARHFFKNPALDVLKVVEINDFSRYDVEVPLYISWDVGDIFKVYAAPKYIYGRTKLDEQLINYAEQGKPVTGFDASLPAQVNSHFAGSTFGLSLGYKYVHLYAELTGGYTFCEPWVFGAKRDLGGATFYPAAGIAFRNGASSKRP
ncbi:hypothetical protein POL68_39735 [Stigmatella sp. ncwal1]|uniref:Outer membrane protein beta-barrel domain-containing protein n=1 Tax=Stigmatella ashevillensis TaxID=2995309 RepID=A0ABT5DPI3_9BACT|nr:hypothetical protein [Stigmatella ashevillena]MDC0714648.1 hypothetical protein [Stigmatella ashevillena]